MPYISVKDLTKEYRNGDIVTKANNNINFTVEKGEFAVILGASGAGKSTTLNLIGGMDSPTSGDIIIDGQNIANYNSKELTKFRRDHIGFVFQNYNLIPNLTAKENVELAIEISKSDYDVMEVLEMVGLTDRANNFPAELSGGEQQRVSIARAIAGKPSILLADEPTGALDNDTGIQVLRTLHKITRQLEATVVLITHNYAISHMGDRVIEIRNGVVEQEKVQPNPTPIDEIVW